MGLTARELTAASPSRLFIFHEPVFNMDYWLDRFDVTDMWGMRECCIDAFHDPNNLETYKVGGLMCKSCVFFVFVLTR